MHERHADQRARDDVPPERRRRVAERPGQEIREADEKRHDIRPRAAIRDEVGDEEPAGGCRDERDEREVPATPVVDRRRKDEELEREMRDRPAGKR